MNLLFYNLRIDIILTFDLISESITFLSHLERMGMKMMLIANDRSADDDDDDGKINVF